MLKYFNKNYSHYKNNDGIETILNLLRFTRSIIIQFNYSNR